MATANWALGRVENIEIENKSMGLCIFFGLDVSNAGKNFLEFLIGGNGFENLKIPIIGSKIKVVADLSSDLSK